MFLKKKFFFLKKMKKMKKSIKNYNERKKVGKNYKIGCIPPQRTFQPRGIIPSVDWERTSGSVRRDRVYARDHRQVWFRPENYDVTDRHSTREVRRGRSWKKNQAKITVRTSKTFDKTKAIKSPINTQRVNTSNNGDVIGSSRQMFFRSLTFITSHGTWGRKRRDFDIFCT